MNSLLEKVNAVNLVAAAGSVDGTIATAAVVGYAAEGCVLVFTQAFQVKEIQPATWGANRNILLVDLAVNNRDAAMTVDFLLRVTAAGHTIVGVCDEHDGEAWQQAFADAGLDFDALAIKPVTGKGTNDLNSSGALFLSLLGNEADEHTRKLCLAADAGDRMDDSNDLARMVRRASKSNITDNSRREYLARHLAHHTEPDATIAGWMKEYDAILATHEQIVTTRIELGNGIVRVNTTGRTIDMTAFMDRLYGMGYKVVVIDGESYNIAKKAKERQISFGLKPGVKIDILGALKGAGITASGFANKVNIDPKDEAAAIPIVLQLLS